MILLLKEPSYELAMHVAKSVHIDMFSLKYVNVKT